MRSIELTLTPAESERMESAVERAISSHPDFGPVSVDEKPRHLGNFRFSFNKVPTWLMVATIRRVGQGLDRG